MIINTQRKPTLSLYYLGAVVLELLSQNDGISVDELFKLIDENFQNNLHVDFFYYSLDWLYVLSIIKIEIGRVYLCE